jgi:hypothetical protein
MIDQEEKGRLVAYDLAALGAFLNAALFKSRGTDYRLTPKRIAWGTLFAAVYPPLELATWAGLALDELLFGAYREQAIRQPTFIIGNPRSGTTLLHRLLAKDKHNWTSMTSWEIWFAPSVVARKVERGLAALDGRLGSPLHRWLRALEARWQDEVVTHKLSLLAPEEDEYMLLHIWSTLAVYHFGAVPDGSRIYTWFDDRVGHEAQQRILDFYRRCVQRHLYAHRDQLEPETCYLAKNPAFSAKVEALCERFPDARFVYLARNPLDMIPSYVSTLQQTWRTTGDPVEAWSCRDYVLDMASYWYRHPLERLDRAPPGRCAIVRYEDLVSDPEGTVEALYRQLGRAIEPGFARILAREGRVIRQYESRHQYAMEEMGLSREQIVEAFGDVFERFGFGTRQ